MLQALNVRSAWIYFFAFSMQSIFSKKKNKATKKTGGSLCNAVSNVFYLQNKVSKTKKKNRKSWSKPWSKVEKFSSHWLLTLYHIILTFNPFQMTNFRLSKTERVCRWQFQISWKWQKALQTGRKHYGKRRNFSLPAISSFPIVFSKDLYSRHVKTRACLGKC